MWSLKCWEKEQPHLETGTELLLMMCFNCWKTQTSVKGYDVFCGCGKVSALNSQLLLFMQ